MAASERWTVSMLSVRSRCIASFIVYREESEIAGDSSLGYFDMRTPHRRAAIAGCLQIMDLRWNAKRIGFCRPKSPATMQGLSLEAGPTCCLSGRLMYRRSKPQIRHARDVVMNSSRIILTNRDRLEDLFPWRTAAASGRSDI